LSPARRCWAGEHLPIGLLSVLMLVVFTVGFPVATFFYIQRALQQQTYVDEVFKNFIRTPAARHGCTRTAEQMHRWDCVSLSRKGRLQKE
jgi:hypothetical protein